VGRLVEVSLLKIKNMHIEYEMLEQDAQKIALRHSPNRTTMWILGIIWIAIP
jgi:hypothetical protein